jgi:outer membrane protein
MKQFLVISNIVLLVAAGVLFYLHFSYRSDLALRQQQDAELAKNNNNKLVYFIIDSVENNYSFFKEVKEYIEDRSAAIDKKMENMRVQYTNKINEFNKKGPGLTQTEQSQMQEEIMRLEANIRQQQQDLITELQNETSQKSLDVKTRIQDVLKGYSAKKGYMYVFATGSESDMVYYKDSLKDITKELIVELNNEYKAKQKK